MKMNSIITMFFALCWLLGMTACKKEEVVEPYKNNETWLYWDDLIKVETQDVDSEKFDFIRHINLTFRWHIENPKEGVTYNSIFLFDRNIDDTTGYEEYILGDKTEYTIEFLQDVFIYLTRWRWPGLSGWAVKIKATDGQVYESYIHKVNILDRIPDLDNVKVILDDPPDYSELVEGNITFRWHLENAKEGVTYNYVIVFDKGIDPFDGWHETHMDVGEATEYTRYMSAGWWSWGFDWGVMVESSDGLTGKSPVQTVESIIKK